METTLTKLGRVCPGQGKMAGSAASPSPEPGYAFAGARSIVSCAQSSKPLSSKLFFNGFTASTTVGVGRRIPGGRDGSG